METFTPEQRQALQNAHQQVVQAAAQQAQQAQQELTERVAALQLELDRARGARRTEAGMTGKPIPLNRTGGNWEEFILKLKAFVGLRSEPLVRVMERMEEPNAVDPDIEDLEGVSIDIGTENRNLYNDLTMLTTGTSLKLVKGVAGNNGLEAYRQLCRRWHAGTRGRNLARLQAILQWNFGTSATEILDSLAAWESEIEEWEQLTGERMADSIKLCVLDSQAPKELSTNLRLHTQAEETFATVKRKIQDYLQAIDQSGPVPMEVGFVGKKGKKGKGKQPKGGGKQNKGKDKQPQDKNQHKAHTEKGQNPAQGKQSSGNFQGYCGNCGKWGHPQRECWVKSINNLADSTSASSNSRVDTNNSSGDHGTDAGQGGFAGGILEHDEDDDDKGWILSVGGAGWPCGFQGRPGQWCTILVDSGSSATVCGPQHFPDCPMVPSERLAHNEPSGKPLKHYGQKEVSIVAEDGQSVKIKFDVGKLQQDGKEVVLGKKSYIKECRGRRGVRRLGCSLSRHSSFSGSRSRRVALLGPAWERQFWERRLRTRCGPWRVRRFPACRPMTQSTRWTSSRARMRKWRDRRHVGFLPQRS